MNDFNGNNEEIQWRERERERDTQRDNQLSILLLSCQSARHKDTRVGKSTRALQVVPRGNARRLGSLGFHDGLLGAWGRVLWRVMGRREL